MPFEFGALNESFAALSTDMYAWTVSVEMFAHRRIVAKHFRAALNNETVREKYIR